MLGSQPLSLPYFVAFAPWLPALQGKFREIPESTTQTSNPRFRKLLCLQERRVAEIFNYISQISSHRESIYFSAERQCCEHEIKIQFPRRWTLNFYYKSIKTLLSASCEVLRRRKKLFEKQSLKVTRRVAIFIRSGLQRSQCEVMFASGSAVAETLCFGNVIVCFWNYAPSWNFISCYNLMLLTWKVLHKIPSQKCNQTKEFLEVYSFARKLTRRRLQK